MFYSVKISYGIQDYFLFRRDNAPHTDDPEPDFSVIFNTLSNITGELRAAFHPSIPVLPVLGNHDSYPKVCPSVEIKPQLVKIIILEEKQGKKKKKIKMSAAFQL